MIARSCPTISSRLPGRNNSMAGRESWCEYIFSRCAYFFKVWGFSTPPTSRKTWRLISCRYSSWRSSTRTRTFCSIESSRERRASRSASRSSSSPSTPGIFSSAGGSFRVGSSRIRRCSPRIRLGKSRERSRARASSFPARRTSFSLPYIFPTISSRALTCFCRLGGSVLLLSCANTG